MEAYIVLFYNLFNQLKESLFLVLLFLFVFFLFFYIDSIYGPAERTDRHELRLEASLKHIPCCQNCLKNVPMNLSVSSGHKIK